MGRVEHWCLPGAALERFDARVYHEPQLAHCPHYGSPVTIIAAIKDPAVIAKIPAHLGLPTRPLPYLVETTV